MNYGHEPVLLNEVIKFLEPKSGEFFVDATLGAGGHAEKILEKIMPDGFLIGFDCDSSAIGQAEERLNKYKKNCLFINDNFSNLVLQIKKNNISGVDGVLLDLGVSSMQLDNKERGFSFKSSGPLDMRMAENKGISAFDVVNSFEEKEIADIIWKYGEERLSRRIARAIINHRKEKKIETTGELADIAARAYGARTQGSFRGIHPATRTFQALRIFVNKELESLETVIESVIDILNHQGRIGVISYHSLEDRIVKNKFKEFKEKGLGDILTKKPIAPTEEEVDQNRRARSAKFRVFKKN